MTKRKTHDEFVKEVQELYDGEYSVVGTYVLTKYPVTMRHNTCGNVWDIKPNLFLRGRKCPACSKKNSFKTLEKFKQEVYELYGGKVEVIGEYVNCDYPIEARCVKHNVVFKRTPSTILKGKNNCTKCYGEMQSKNQRKSPDVFLQQLYDKHGGTIECLENYVNTHTKIKFRCTICKEEFIAEPNSVIRISGCPSCREPHGEKYIREYLKLKGTEFETQKAFYGLVYKHPLYFDFFLPKYNLLIEYDGKQHFTSIDFFGGEDMFRYQKERDDIKNRYAKNNKINLLRIPHTIKDENIEKEIEKTLKSLSY